MEKGSNHYSNPTFLTMLALENNNNKLAKRTLQLDKEEWVEQEQTHQTQVDN